MGLKEIQELKANAGKPKVKQYTIPKVSKKKAAQLQAAKDENGDNELQRWFRARMKFMSPVCAECGQKVETGIYKFAIMHIAHVLPKRDNMCPSVKYHPLNFITLCVDHHHKYDHSTWDEIEQWGCWKQIREKLIFLFEDLAEDEKRHFPPKLRHEIENNQF